MTLSRVYTLVGRLLLIVLLIWWTVQLITQPNPWILLDSVNLMFHELGHLLFLFLGEFMHFVGGTIGQLFFPIAFSIYFALKRDWFATSFCLFWLGDNLVNIAIYIKDAQTMALPLLIDGSVHDWHWLLTSLNVIRHASRIGSFVFSLAGLILFGSIGLACYVTFRDSIEGR